MVDDPLVEAVGRHRRCRCLQPQLAARDEPHQITLACAVRAVALIELVRRAFDLERDLSAMTAAAQRLHGPDSVARGHTVCATRRGAAKSAVLGATRSEEHTSALQSLMRISYDVFCWTNKINALTHTQRE